MCTSERKKIGLFDSGLGGLTVLRAMHKALPRHDYIYLGDNARFPYGTKGSETIVRYARECTRFLMNRQIDILIIACNTASAAALSTLESELEIPVIGTIGPAVRQALMATRAGRVGILGTNATVASQVYETALHAAEPSLEVVSQACPLFVPLVEAGMLKGEIVDKVIELYLEPLQARGVDTIILGCTHYPLLAEAIRAYVGHYVSVVECSEAIAHDVTTMLGVEPGVATTSGETRFFVTDEVGKFNYIATALLEREAVSAVRIDSL